MAVDEMRPLKLIGKNLPRIGAGEKASGSARFCADMKQDSPLVLKVLRSGRAHAKIIGIDTTGAERIPGLVRVFTAKDVPGTNLTGIINKDQPLLQPDKTRSVADAIALVAAETESAARLALEAIVVNYEALPAVFDPEAALKPDAPKIHDKGNLLVAKRVRKGDPDVAFDNCASVAENIYTTSRIEHTCLEPDAGAGYVDSDGTLVIHASTQNPHYDRKEVASLLGIAEDRVRIIQATTGGGFGSKLDLNVQGFVGLALYHLRRPVRHVYTREESFLATAKRHPVTIFMKTGTDENGRLRAMRARIVCDTGAYGSYGIPVASRSAIHATGPYRIENVEIESLCVYTNNPFSGAMRGFGVPQVAFAHESQLDIHARELGIDPLEIRMRNAFVAGSETATGQILKSSVGILECLEAVRPYYETARKVWLASEAPFKKRGVGIGAMWYGIGNTGVQNPSTARIEMDPDGSVTLFTGCADLGQGATTVLGQIASEVLGLDFSKLRIIAADTRFTSDAGATSASRQTYISGNAVRNAAEKLADVLKTEAANRLRVPRMSVIFEDGHAVSDGNPENRIGFDVLAKRLLAKGVPLSWQGYFDPETVAPDPETGRGVPYATHAFACQLALVEADTLTGEVAVEKIVAAHDVGRAIHPENVAGQICGGVAMGLGLALMEEFEPGTTASMKEYHLPTVADMPKVVPIIVESQEPTGPFGAKGVGEPALIPTAPAIANALADALGKRIFSLPANPERVLRASINSGLFRACLPVPGPGRNG